MTVTPSADPVVSLREIASIRMRAEHQEEIVAHARRKLRGDYREGETPTPQAFGLLAGSASGDTIETTAVLPLRRNLRTNPVHGAVVDAVVRGFAVASRTPLDQRGWIAAPQEVLEAEERCDAAGAQLFGSYHVHKVPWRDDPLRDTPTALDAALSQGQGLWTLILSMVDPDRPTLRAFWEGRREAEVKLVIG